MPLPSTDFDPTESAVPFRFLKKHGHQFVFATPDAKPAQADQHMLEGNGLGLLRPFLMADKNARSAYDEMQQSEEFLSPISYDDIDIKSFDAILLPGGHAQGMKPYLESSKLQNKIAEHFSAGKATAAICHGVVLAARSVRQDGKSILYGFQTTALLQKQEMLAWQLTRAWLGNYYRTYDESVQTEVTAALAKPGDFQEGSIPLTRDSENNLKPGFVVHDRHYLSARWPGDAHKLANELQKMLTRSPGHGSI
ncbi:MAG: type 1 glutamine amidotransferase domain-containing protein [Arenimonas sp.]